jgi:uncharacterized protein YgiM (DUF1202 family)
MKRFIAVTVLLLCAGMLAFAAPAASNEAFVLLNNLAFYSESGGTLKWAESLAIGDKVVLLNRTSKFKVEGKEREYTKVRSPSAKEGWVLTPYIAAKSALGVVKADSAIVYSEPRDVKITSKHISHLTIVAVMQEGGSAGFVKVACYDIPQNAYFTDPVFISSDDLTMADIDVNAAILYTVAMASKDQGVKKNLLTVASNKYGTSLFIGKIQEAMGSGGAPRATAAASGRYAVNSDKVNVRSAPDEKTSQVVGQLDDGDEVTVVEMTSQAYTVDGQNARWFRVEDPAGWIFGYFLTPLQ